MKNTVYLKTHEHLNLAEEKIRWQNGKKENGGFDTMSIFDKMACNNGTLDLKLKTESSLKTFRKPMIWSDFFLANHVGS